MSHEIRTPMNALLGMAELLGETPLSAEQREYVRIFRRAGDNLLNVVNDILDFSKVEAGQVELENIPFDLADVLEGVMEVVAVQAHAKGLELSGRIRPEVPAWLIGDPGRLRQVLLNLLGNATKFTDLGELAVVVDIDRNDPTPGALHFAVSDTGAGIPANRISRIFDSFTQADASTTRKFGGTGLGLAISKRFVELMGGRIWAESVPGAGTTMHLTARFGVQDIAGTLPSELIGVRCLVVDDNASHRGSIVDTLTRWGAQVNESNGPTAALDQINAADPPYDLVLVDGRMITADDGFGLATRIKEEQRARRVVVMLTTDRVVDAARCRELGLGYLLKPVRRSELGEAMGVLPPRQTESDTQPTAVRALRILLADDSEDNRFLVRGYLKDCGYLVDEVENGALAVEHFKKGTYDLVLTDVEMPVLDGYSATRQMRLHEKERGYPPTPILALTAHALKEAKDRSGDAGCTGHLTKPIRKAALLEAIRRYAREPQTSGRIEVAVEPWLQPVVSGYLEKRRADVAKLRSAIEQSDYSIVRMLGHQMAGTGASYGFSSITDIGLGLEESALDRDAERIHAGIEELERYLRLVDVN
jgi:CheY-like chemotaxis protein